MLRNNIQYFKAFGAVAVLCIEMKLQVGSDDERLKIIAQVIADCDLKPSASLAYIFTPDLGVQAVTSRIPPEIILYLFVAFLRMA